MQFEYNSYIWPLSASAFTSLSLGVFTLLKRRNARGATSFILSMFVVSVWSGGNALEMSGTDFSTKLFWANMQYLAYCYSPVTLLALCMEFTGYDTWVHSRKFLWVAAIPTIIIILVWTDGLHGLMRYDMSMDYSGAFPVIAKKYGPIFYIHAAYAHFLNIAASVFLIRTVFFKKNTLYRKQAAALLIGVSMIVIPNVLYISGLSPVKRFDITPLFFGPAGLVMAWGIFHLKMFDLIPLARETVIETMDAGMMVLDLQNRVLDINPACERIIGLTVSQVTAGRAEEVCGGIPELIKVCIDESMTHTEFSANTKDTSRIFEVLLSPLTDSGKMLIGRLAMIYDVTDIKKAQRELLAQQRRIAVIEERNRMARNMHDDLGQVLGFINLQAQGIRQELINAGVDIAVHELDRLAEVTQSAHNEVREYIRSARSTIVTEMDFIAALAMEVTNFEKQTELKVKLDVPAEFTGEELKPDKRVNALNIIREALNNIRKHADAENVKITLLHSDKLFCITVEDDGKGFDVGRRVNESASGFGLGIMQERALEIGGQAEIESAIGKGSRVVLRVPIEEEEGKNEN